MRNSLLGSLAALLLGSSVVQAQTVPIAQLPPMPAGAPSIPTGPVPTPIGPLPVPTGAPPTLEPSYAGDGYSHLSGYYNDNNNGGCYTSWGSVDTLFWHFRDAPVRVPLVSDQNKVLFGDRSYTEGWNTGFQFTAGTWLDCDKTVGVEASGFYFVPRTPTLFSMRTTNPGQILAIPFNNVTPGGGSGGINPANLQSTNNGPNAFLISGGSGGALTGGVNVASSTTFWGAELNGVFNLVRNDRVQVNLLAGFRYADLQENLYVNTAIQNPNVGPLDVTTFADHFGTRNQFYGGQLGMKGEWSNGVFFVNGLAKVALGADHETVNVDGNFADIDPLFFTNFGAGKMGLLTQQTNIGSVTHNHFVVLPEVQLQIGLNVTGNLRVFTGYDFLYMNSVVRPGNQIDNNINLSQVGPTAGHAVSPLSGPPASPGVPFQQSSFWAQGLLVGLEYRY